MMELLNVVFMLMIKIMIILLNNYNKYKIIELLVIKKVKKNIGLL